MTGNSTTSFDVLGVPITVTSLRLASEKIRSWAGDRTGRFICVRDVHGVMQARNDPELLEIHRRASMVTPDGMPLVWIGRTKKLPVSRTCGPDLMERVIADTQSNGIRHYFYGGKPGVAQKLAQVFSQTYPGLRVTGTETPPFSKLTPEEVRELADRILASHADVVWIGLSTPKQEILMDQLAPLTSSTFIGVGAAFDFHAGTVQRAPLWMQRSGLEWLFRLMAEPRRLWRRYLIMAPKFVFAILRARLTR